MSEMPSPRGERAQIHAPSRAAGASALRHVRRPALAQASHTYVVSPIRIRRQPVTLPAMSVLMDDTTTDDIKAPERNCDICGAPMVLVSTLPATDRFPQQHIYKCSACKFAVADTVAR